MKTLHMTPSRVLSSLALLAAMSGSWAASAGEEPRHVLVMIAFESQKEVDESISAAVAARLVDLQVELVVKWVDEPRKKPGDQLELARSLAKPEETVGVCWYTIGDGGEGLLHLADANQQRALLRRLAAEEQRGRFEEIALILQSAIEAMLRGGEIGITVPEISKPVTEPAPEAPAPEAPQPAESPEVGEDSRPAHLLGVELAYAVQMRSKENLSTHGLHMALVVRPYEGLVLRAGYVLWTPTHAETRNISIKVIRHPTFAGLGYGFELGRVVLGGGISVVVDHVTQSTPRLYLPEAGSTGHGHSDLLVALDPEINLEAYFTDRFFMVVRVGVQLFLNNIQYLYDTGAGFEIVESPWSAQPHGFLGVGAWLF